MHCFNLLLALVIGLVIPLQAAVNNQLKGGPMGALFVFGTTLLAPRLGVAAMLALIICGQIASSLMFDRFGVLGLPLREISTPRLIGAALVVAGVLLVNFG